jgi:hypothetical protein
MLKIRKCTDFLGQEDAHAHRLVGVREMNDTLTNYLSICISVNLYACLLQRPSTEPNAPLRSQALVRVQV